MNGKDTDIHRRGLHRIIASDRLIRHGKTLEECNDHLTNTPHELLVRENLEYLESIQPILDEECWAEGNDLDVHNASG